MTPVPLRSSTRTVSAPPKAFRSTASSSAVSIVMFPASRRSSSRFPFGERATCSLAAEPLKTIASVPSCPLTVSLPSPGSQTKVSSPAPRNTTSLPPLPSIESLPSPPRRVSAPEPPVIESLPSPPSIVVGMLPVNAPLASSTTTVSSPAPASTAILAMSTRSKLNSAVRSSPTSTWSMSGRPACSRRAIVSLASVPSIVSRPCFSFGCLNFCAARKCEALRAPRMGAAWPCPVTIAPIAPATAATARPETANCAGLSRPTPRGESGRATGRGRACRRAPAVERAGGRRLVVDRLVEAARAAERKGAPGSRQLCSCRRALDEPPSEADGSGLLLELGMAEALGGLPGWSEH